MFWRQATNVKVLVDAAGRTLGFASEGSEYNDKCIVYNQSTDTVTTGDVVMVEGIDNWGTTEITVSTVDNVSSFTVDGTTYSFTDGGPITPTITEFTPIPINGRIQVFKDYNCTEYADGNEREVYVRINTNIAVGNSITIGTHTNPSGYVYVAAGETEGGELTGILWTDWYISTVVKGAITSGSVFMFRTNEVTIPTVVDAQVIFE